MNDLIKLLPSDQELAKLSTRLNTTVTSREQLLTRVGTLNLEETPLEEKMVYVLGLVSLGFDPIRARKRLGVKNSHFYIWKQDERHEAMLESSQANGEMVLEEKVLVEAETNPKMAFNLLKERNNARDKKDDREQDSKSSVWDIMQKTGQDRGIIVEGELIDSILK